MSLNEAGSVQAPDQLPAGQSNCGPYEVSLLRLAGLQYRELTTQSLRYSEFDDLRQRLVSSFPHARNALPALPPKSVLCMINPSATIAAGDSANPLR